MAAKTAKEPRPKHVPLRTCIACRQGEAKRKLVRIVRTPGGEVRVDSTGKLSGRGAYLCPNRSCWDLALKKRIIEHALHAALTPEARVSLEQYAGALPVSVLQEGGE